MTDQAEPTAQQILDALSKHPGFSDGMVSYDHVLELLSSTFRATHNQVSHWLCQTMHKLDHELVAVRTTSGRVQELLDLTPRGMISTIATLPESHMPLAFQNDRLTRRELTKIHISPDGNYCTHTQHHPTRTTEIWITTWTVLARMIGTVIHERDHPADLPAPTHIPADLSGLYDDDIGRVNVFSLRHPTNNFDRIGADLYFDVHSHFRHVLPPGLTGPLTNAQRAEILATPGTRTLITHLANLTRDLLADVANAKGRKVCIGLGCPTGAHLSLALAEELAHALRAHGIGTDLYQHNLPDNP